MPCQVHATHTYPDQQKHAEADELANQAIADAQTRTADITVDDIDEILDEIDSVLEENALEFVRAYVQKGGQ